MHERDLAIDEAADQDLLGLGDRLQDRVDATTLPVSPPASLDGLTSDEREELSRLRRELRVAREERDVLANIAFFTKGPTR